MLFATVIIATLLYLLYKYWITNYSYWEKRGIPYYPAKFPYGSDPNLVQIKTFRGYTIEKMYRQFASHPLFGVYILRDPVLIVKDPELIQQILVKDFSHFRDRGVIQVTDKDLINHNIIFLDGEKWRALRVKLSPSFTSGKLKNMFPLFVSCAESFNKLLMTKVNSNVNMKELTSHFTADVIGSTAFGLKTDAVSDTIDKLKTIGSEGNKWNVLPRLKVAVCKIFPALSSLLPIRFVSAEDEQWVIDVVTNIIQQREKSGVARNDFIDLLIQLKNKGSLGEEDEGLEKPYEMTYELMAAQCFVFFVGGFDTSSSVLSSCLYELAINPDIQSRLIKEIDEKIGNNEITYKAIQEMEYLDMVISETSRKYPTQGILFRKCTKPITLSSGHKIDQGISVFIPVWSLHYDSQYFPDPHKFDPERFSPENKDSIVPFTYLPFGEGPRVCIGMRFGRLQTKVGLVTILRKFRVEPCEKTNIPLVFKGGAMLITPAEPIVLKLIARD